MNQSGNSLGPQHVDALCGMARQFAQAWAERLKPLLKEPPAMEVVSCRQVRDGEFAAANLAFGVLAPADPTCVFGLCAQDSGREAARLELEPALAQVLIDMLVGGGQSPPRRGPLTDIDRRILLPAIEQAAAALCVCADGGAGVALSVAAASLQPQSPAVAAEVAFGSAGAARLVLGEDFAAQCLRRMGHSLPVLLSAYVEESISPQELSALNVGDMLASDVAPGGEVVVELAGRGRYAATLGQLNGRRALTIVRKID